MQNVMELSNGKWRLNGLLFNQTFGKERRLFNGFFRTMKKRPLPCTCESERCGCPKEPATPTNDHATDYLITNRIL